MAERILGDGAEIYRMAQQQVDEISSLIPVRGIPVEERARLNSQVRVLLPPASDLAIVLLMNRGHDLSRREFITRLREQRIEQTEAAFAFMEDFSRVYPYRSLLFLQVRETAVRCAPETSLDRMVD